MSRDKVPTPADFYTGQKAQPTPAELDRIAIHACVIAMKENATEDRCPFGEEDSERRDHWIAIFRIWREEATRAEEKA